MGYSLRVFLFCACVAQAQQAVTSATVVGQIQDASRAPVAGLVVSMINLDRNQTRLSTTDEKGRYQFLYLPAGNYNLTIDDSRFALVSHRLALSAGQALDIPVQLAVAGLRESVTVTAAAAVLDTARTQAAETVAPREIDA